MKLILSSEALLKKDGYEWRVDFIFGSFTGEGWAAFAEECDLKCSDFIVFKHRGNMVFDAKVFYGRSQCKKVIPTEDVEEPVPRLPRFTATIRQYSIKWGFLNLPKAFSEANGLMGRNGEITVKDERERSWYFDLSSPADGRVRIRRGSKLPEFFKANGFRIGDFYQLEIVVAGNGEELSVVRVVSGNGDFYALVPIKFPISQLRGEG